MIEDAKITLKELIEINDNCTKLTELAVMLGNSNHIVSKNIALYSKNISDVIADVNSRSLEVVNG